MTTFLTLKTNSLHKKLHSIFHYVTILTCAGAGYIFVNGRSLRRCLDGHSGQALPTVPALFDAHLLTLPDKGQYTLQFLEKYTKLPDH